MLAFKYTEHGHKINFPCYVQPKIDGLRAIYKNGEFYSRLNNKFNSVDHILHELNQKVLPILDGELYTNKVHFNKLSGMIRKKSGHSDDNKHIKYYVFDLINNDTYENRLKQLKQIFQTNKFDNVVFVKTEIANNPEDIYRLHKQYEKEGYEGIMVREKTKPYEMKRSYGLQKLKSFEDDEFKIVGYEIDVNGGVIWVCDNKHGGTFTVRSIGTNEERENMLKNVNKFIGKQLTVKFQGKSEDYNPRFPVGIAIRGKY